MCRTILVEKTDRLYRNIRDWITVDDLDLTVHFVKENAVVSKKIFVPFVVDPSAWVNPVAPYGIP